MVFLEKILVVFKDNKLSEGKWMGHIGLEFGGHIDEDDGKDVFISADFWSAASIWKNSQVLLKNANPNVIIDAKSPENSKNNKFIEYSWNL